MSRVAFVVAVVVLVMAPSAVAAPVTATAPGKSFAGPSQSIETLTTSFDPDTGAWTTTVTFRAPQTDQTDSTLVVGLVFLGESSTELGWSTETHPEHPTFAQFSTKPGEGGYSADGTAVTYTITDPASIGRKPAYVVAEVQGHRSDVDEMSEARAVLGPPAPVAVIPHSATRLTVDRHGRVRIPLVPLASEAWRRITIKDSRNRVIVIRGLTGGSKMTSLSVSVPAFGLRRLSRRFRRATMQITTTAPDYATATTSRTISIRRR